MSQSLISIIVPIYKAELFLEQCLESLCQQTYTNLEIICINDGSPDNCMTILNRYKEIDKRIVIINKTNEGVSAARNDALKHIHGEYVTFVDADDWLDSHTIEYAVKAIKDNDCDIVMWSYISEHVNRSDIKHIFPKETLFAGDQVKYKLHRRLIGIIDDELTKPEQADSLCTVWGKLYKAELLKGISFVDLTEIGTYEDGLFNLYVFDRVNKSIYIDQPFYHYRHSSNESQTERYKPDLYKQWQHLFDIMKIYIDNNHCSAEYYTALKNRIALSIIGLGLNQCSSNDKITNKAKEIKKIITSSQYESAYRQLKLQYFPIYWKVFFFCAKVKFSFGLLVLLQIIRKFFR